MRNDPYYLEAVKNVVLIRRDAPKPPNEHWAVELPAQASPMKYMFNYLSHNKHDHASLDQVD